MLNVMSSAAFKILAAGYVLPLLYLIWSLRYGKAAGPNPWQATGLEWLTPSRRPRRTSSRRPWSSKRLTTTRTSNPRLSDHWPEDRSVQR